MQIAPDLVSPRELIAHGAEIANFCAKNASAIDLSRSFPQKEFAKIAAGGLLVAPLRCSFGGFGLGFESRTTGHLLRLLQTLGKGNLSVGRIYEGHVNALQLIQTFGRAEQLERFAVDAREQKLFGVWNAEATDGLKFNPTGKRKYELTGSKTFCSGAGSVQRPLVGGSLPDGKLQLCVIPMDQVKTQIDPAWWTATGMRGSVSAKVDFSGVVLDKDWLIGDPEDYHREPWLTLGTIRFAAVQLGGAEALVEATRSYLQKLERTTDPYQVARMGHLILAIETGRLWLESAARKTRAFAPIFGDHALAKRSDAMELTIYANLVRTTVEQLAMDVIKDTERCIGSRGLLPPEPAERIIRDLQLYLRQPCFDAALAKAGAFALSNPPRSPIFGDS